MYRPHEAREDTVLFPAFRKLVSHHEYGALGEAFEKNEHQLFGQDGFETMVGKSRGNRKITRHLPVVPVYPPGMKIQVALMLYELEMSN